MAAARTGTADYPAPSVGSRIRDWASGLFSDRARLRRVLMIWGVGIIAVLAAYFWLTGGRYVSTDDAYVHAAKLMVSTDVSGLVTEVNVKEGQVVKKGDVLFRLDPRPFEIAVTNAQAALLQARQDAEATRAAYRAVLGQIGAQAAQVNLAALTNKRMATLAASQAISRAQYDTARANLAAAQAMLASLQANAATTLAKLSGNPALPAEQTPAYLKAKGALEEAQRQLDHTVVRAPFDGVVSEVDSLQPGTLVISAMSAFTTTSAVGLVSSKNIWVGANMKETDLTYVHEGMPVEITVDTYPSCTWNGVVDSVAQASDSAFSPLPSENASGNWVKVVQRIGTKVRITGGNCSQATLRAGMSTAIVIDTGRRRWNRWING
ncbi:MAG: HlyD family secretion protein [Alphaproteobacteria bacterium]|nr:HlyD family secretion protein [Alphaproteobacteria bacterium]